MTRMVIRILLTFYLISTCTSISTADITVPPTYPVYPEPPPRPYTPVPVYNPGPDQREREKEVARKAEEAKEQADLEQKKEEERVRQKAFYEKKAEVLTRLKSGAPNLNSSGSQLKSVDYHSGNAQALPKELSKGEAQRGFDTQGENKGALVYVLPEQMSTRVKNDKRMKKAQKELRDIQAKRLKLDEQLTQLLKERNTTTDPAKMKQLTKKLNSIDKDYQNNLFAEYNQKEKVKKIHRTIDAKPVSSRQSSEGSGK
ncbi:MAG: hypothetical protein JJE30_06625 [Desulfuromonadales bacterium]|nr:hypothetical protein [Desulfuromonadales bacterium]